jgi:hypothetical protein
MTEEFYAEFRSYSECGFIVIPISSDGDGKRPAVKWRGFYTGDDRYDIARLRKLFLENESAALLTGSCSGNVEIVDIDTKYDLTGDLHKRFSHAIKARIPDFFKRNPCVVQTRSGGYHIIYRVNCDYKDGNRKLASRPLTEEELMDDPSGRSRVLLETRGNGGYALIAPSQGYKILQGSYTDLPVLTLEERDLIMEAGLSLNEVTEVKPNVTPRQRKEYSDGFDKTPWEDFCERVPCEEVLNAHGYRSVGVSRNDILVLRPGQAHSSHSGYVHTDTNIFVCFSASTPFEPGKGYSSFMVYTVLKHRGDVKEAIRAIASQGFGSSRRLYGNQAANPYNGHSAKTEYTPIAQVDDADVQDEPPIDIGHDGPSEQAVKKIIGNYTLSDEVQRMITEKTNSGKELSAILGYQLDKDTLANLVGFPMDAQGYIDSIRNGTFVMGGSTGSTYLDQYFRFKSSLIVVVHGIANVGKSLFTWYLAMLSAAMHNWRWILYVAENDYEHCVRSLVQFHGGKWVSDMSYEEYRKAMDFVDRHFVIIKNTSTYSASEACALAEYLHLDPNVGPFNAFVIDPYNSLVAETRISEGLRKVHSTKHDLDYEVMSAFRGFCKRTGMALYLNCHTGTEKARNVQSTGKAPNMYDVEGGGKFANRADDFITTHRNTKDSERSMITEMHVDKIKTTETGGRPTSADGPVEFFLWFSKYRFVILDPSSGYAVDPLEIALKRGNGMYPKSMLRVSFSAETEPEPQPEDKIGAMQAIPPVSFFDSSSDDGLDF